MEERFTDEHKKLLKKRFVGNFSENHKKLVKQRIEQMIKLLGIIDEEHNKYEVDVEILALRDELDNIILHEKKLEKVKKEEEELRQITKNIK
jgi:hypothetical protein